MKIVLLTLFALAGTAFANPTAMQARGLPQPGSEAAHALLDLVSEGMKSWGLAGGVNPPSGNPSGPSRNMPGGLPELNRPHPPKQNGVPGTPGNPLGPRKKQGRIYPRGKSCTKKRGMQCSADTTATGRSSRYPKLRLNGRGGAMVAFANLSPHAHDILAAVQKWDNPASRAVAWFDGAMADLQESIGGKQVPEIHGNELKLWLICLLRSDNPRYPDAVDKACQRRKAAPVEEQKYRQGINGLNQVAELCEKAEEDPPSDENMKTEVLEHCDKFAETLENMIDSNAGLVLLGEWARARTLNNHGIEESDQLIAKEFIQKGAFGPAVDETEAGEVATLYLEHMSTYAIIEVEEDGVGELIKHDSPPSWLELLQMGAGYVPQDRAAVDEALKLLEGSPHLRHLDKEGRDVMLPVATCWDQAGLLAFQPRRWDLISAAMVYLEGKLRDTKSTLSCAPCMAPEGFWLLRCGSAFP
ncbi:hypothetical protein ISF_09128 [Cordyceps fumosorosea ARSEF 2679]|uniref:Heat-labile enterotoxin IIA, A chain n=1 Tax=Cordyceps fumosorosea (strain ARSEF 2679) TaxID=1081104 RepID=A0A162M9K5_CORFA|nr:hypothetical protein ISF_09128 [Cordyceps fumosorosea ARSEF 2679]OAA52960.1 hypothetical protein ISF_09128 [Cordyceps fumosorosea ARSEF 2679]